MTKATIIDAAWANQVREGIAAAVEAAWLAPRPLQFCIARTDIGHLEVTKIYADWLSQGGMLRLLERSSPSPDLPDVPLHQRGFGVRGEGAQ